MFFECRLLFLYFFYIKEIAIQCLSNIQPLTDYFLNGIHKLELNTANPLGSKGKILQNYASLIEKIWCSHENPFIAPTEFLYCISELYPQVIFFEFFLINLISLEMELSKMLTSF